MQNTNIIQYVSFNNGTLLVEVGVYTANGALARERWLTRVTRAATPRSPLACCTTAGRSAVSSCAALFHNVVGRRHDGLLPLTRPAAVGLTVRGKRMELKPGGAYNTGAGRITFTTVKVRVAKRTSCGSAAAVQRLVFVADVFVCTVAPLFRTSMSLSHPVSSLSAPTLTLAEGHSKNHHHQPARRAGGCDAAVVDPEEEMGTLAQRASHPHTSASRRCEADWPAGQHAQRNGQRSEFQGEEGHCGRHTIRKDATMNLHASASSCIRVFVERNAAADALHKCCLHC